VAAAITDATGVEVELIKGSKGIFEVSVDGDVVAEKSRGAFPEPAACVEAVRIRVQDSGR